MQITELLTVMTVFISTALVIILTIKIISDNSTRKKAIEAGASSELLQELLKNRAWLSGHDPLKWGMLVAAVGAAFILIDVLGIDYETAMAPGIVFLLPGLALVAYRYISGSKDD